MNAREIDHGKRGSASMPSAFESHAVAKMSDALTGLLADLFALYVKTKNFHAPGSSTRQRPSAPKTRRKR